MRGVSRDAGKTCAFQVANQSCLLPEPRSDAPRRAATLLRFWRFTVQLCKLGVVHATPDSVLDGFRRRPVAASGETSACNDQEMKPKPNLPMEEFIAL